MPDPTPRKPRKHTPKGSEAEIAQRVQTVLGWLSQGERRSVIIRNAREKWNLHDDTIDQYIARAKELWRTENEETRSLAAEYAFKKVMATIERTEGDNERAHLQAIDMLNKMVGNYAPTKQEVTGANGSPLIPDLSHLSLDELVKLADKLGE